MPPWPRDIELEIAAIEHGDPPPTQRHLRNP